MKPEKSGQVFQPRDSAHRAFRASNSGSPLVTAAFLSSQSPMSVPHDPRVAPKEFMALYDPAKTPLPESFQPIHPFDNGDTAVRDEQLASWPRTPEIIRRQPADYYACVTCLDLHVGRIIEHLRQSGELDNTIVIFSGDNGLSLGDHGLLGKQNVYEYGGMLAGKVEEMTALLRKAQEQWGDTCLLVSPTPANPEWTPPSK